MLHEGRVETDPQGERGESNMYVRLMTRSIQITLTEKEKDHSKFPQGNLFKRNSCWTPDVSGAILASGSVIHPEFAEFFQVLDHFACLSTRHLETSWCLTSSARSLGDVFLSTFVPSCKTPSTNLGQIF